MNAAPCARSPSRRGLARGPQEDSDHDRADHGDRERDKQSLAPLTAGLLLPGLAFCAALLLGSTAVLTDVFYPRRVSLPGALAKAFAHSGAVPALRHTTGACRR